MGSNKWLVSSFSVFSIFKSRRPRKVKDSRDEPQGTTKVFRSDDDGGYWVAEPGIDRKASAFIAKFHAARLSESEHQTMVACN
ncbi:hypothetical protein Nepgr_009541 [Nepenthes gracilis]|uniref:Uncharacterized protein n=1 Tax=Nepenthes gracilis TaxID=150966 RepID=A0AAD3SBH8_NEPGR|nr:hypothetical protein Nepgr_009541 [Nepenthes gracilis]